MIELLLLRKIILLWMSVLQLLFVDLHTIRPLEHIFYSLLWIIILLFWYFTTYTNENLVFLNTTSAKVTCTSQKQTVTNTVASYVSWI